MEFASDNLGLLDQEKKRVSELTEKQISLQTDLTERSTDLQNKLNELSKLTEHVTVLESRLVATSSNFVELSKHFENAKESASSIAAELMRIISQESAPAFLKNAQRPETILRPRSPNEATEILEKILTLQDELNIEYRLPKSWADDEFSPSSLSKYTKARYPMLGINEQLQALLLHDIDSAGIRQKLQTLRSLDDAIISSRPAVAAYSRERPDLFSTGTDFITKSLGFSIPEFRAAHAFGDDTRIALSKYAPLLKGGSQ